ncbi:response regulator transcription factor [Colwellia demingiae]|uniref:Response regulator transcription factor n=1 Tax=Colwellia demingiae TaxID=89401 RepID=A0A5C6QSN9_9GAMM|nr:response regulator transcription factor [Colwellia demingiae]TWX71672.1 response regulator transcription factor [Colwellia demingiae]
MILLIEQNVQYAETMGDFLTKHDIELDYAFNGISALALASINSYEVIVINYDIHKLDSLTLCHRLRNELFISTPIIFLGEKDNTQHKIAAFNAGADDFINKPLSFEELHCRIKALTLRGPRRDIGKQTVAKLKIDYNLRTVTCDETTVKLHFLQMNILKVLVQHYPNIVSRQMLEQEIWGEESPASSPLRTHIYRLRMAMEKPFQQPIIDTVYGQGYHLAHPF